MLVEHGGRDQVVQWRGTAIWERIDKAVQSEVERIRVGAQFIPRYNLPCGARSVPRGVIDLDTNGLLTVSEGDDAPLSELSVEFALTQSQVDCEDRLGTAVMLATRAANLLAGAEDQLIFVGLHREQGEVFTQDGRPVNAVSFRGDSSQQTLVPVQLERQPNGLLARNHLKLPRQSTFAWDSSPSFEVVHPMHNRRDQYREQTFEAVSRAYSQLQGQNKLGPLALVLPTDAYTDIFARPESSWDDIPADRIGPLVSAGIYGTNALPEVGNGTALHQHIHPYRGSTVDNRLVRKVGVLLSVGGSSVDLAMGTDATTTFMQVDDDGRYRFRVYERLTLRVKDRQAVVLLTFT